MSELALNVQTLQSARTMFTGKVGICYEKFHVVTFGVLVIKLIINFDLVIF
jgi:hypothetical protein